jgi:hypothetical protein
MPGYSGTPLARKLGFKPATTVVTIGSPPDYASWLDGLPEGVRFVRGLAGGAPVEAAHVFVTKRADLKRYLDTLRRRLTDTGFVWVSWPKKSAANNALRTDITEDVIRELALPLGFVDIKVCAVSEVWSGLKLVIRVTERGAKR